MDSPRGVEKGMTEQETVYVTDVDKKPTLRKIARKVLMTQQASRAMTAVSVLHEKGKDASSVLEPSQTTAKDDLLRNPKMRQRMTFIITLVNCCDMMGELLTMPIMPYYYQSFPDASQEQEDGGLGIYSSNAEKIGLGLTMQVGPAVFTLGGFLAMMASAQLHRTIGKKGSFLVWTFGGAICFLLCGFAGDFRWGLGYFWFLRFLTGVFAGAEATLTAYFSDLIDDPTERANAIGAALGVGLPVGLIAGPVCSGFLIDLNGSKTTLFAPFYFGAALEFIAGILVLFFIVEPPANLAISSSGGDAGKKVEAGTNQEQTDDAKGVHKPPVNWKQLVYLCWFSVALGEFGEGAMNHVQAMGFIRYPWIADNFKWVFMIFSAVVFVALPLSLTLQQYSMAWTVIICRIAAAGTLMLVVTTEDIGPYLFWIYFHYMWKIGGSVPFNNMVIELVPAAERDFWIGADKGVMQLLNGVSPFLFVPMILDSEKWGPYPDNCETDGDYCYYSSCGGLYPSLCEKFRENTFLIVTGVTTGLSVLPLFGGVTRAFPWKAPETKVLVDEEEEAAMRAYRDSGDITWLTGEQLVKVNMELLKQNMPPVASTYGKLVDDISDIPRIRKMAIKDYEFLMQHMNYLINTLQNGSEEDKSLVFDMLKQSADVSEPSEQEREDFLQWFGDWLQYAGYGNPSQMPRMWKALIMTLFPFLIENGEKNPEYLQNPVRFLIRFDNYFRTTLKMEKENDKQWRRHWRQSMKGAFARLRPRGL